MERAFVQLSLFFLALTCVGYASGQPTFEKFYTGSTSYKFNLIELNSSNIIVPIGCGRGLALLDSYGNKILTKCYWGDTLLQISSIKKYSDNEFFFVSGYHKDSCSAFGNFTIPFTYPVIGRMDSLGNVLALKHYILNEGNCNNMTGDLEITADKSVITWGRDALFFALKADSTGAPVWAKQFSNHGGFQFIKELPSGDVLAGINMDSAGTVVARMDAAGNFLWTKSYFRPSGMIQDCLIESDSSFVITGYTDSTNTLFNDPLPPDYQPKLFMMKLNGNGDVQWCKGYDSAPNLWYTRGQRIEQTLDGNYILLADLGAIGSNIWYRPFLMKTDQNGDTLWTRSVGRNGFAYTTKDLLVYSDGGYLFNGIIYGNLPGAHTGLPYIFKTDSLGHLPCWEQRHQTEVSDLFPTDSSFMLTSVDGATVHPAFVSDTAFDPIVVYDGCTFTIGISPSTGRSKNIKVHPNPNQGRFTVEFNDRLTAESFYSVYDTMGKLLYQHPIPKGKETEEIDLSRFGKGIYLLQFNLKDVVHTERVVVE